MRTIHPNPDMQTTPAPALEKAALVWLVSAALPVLLAVTLSLV